MKITNQPTYKKGDLFNPNFKMHPFLKESAAIAQFTTKNNLPLLENNSVNALDMFLTQNMKIDGKFFNHMKYYTQTILNNLKAIKIPENLIGHPHVAISKHLTKNLLPKDDDAKEFDKFLWFTLYPEAPSDCEMSGKDFYKMFYDDEPHCIQQGQFGDCYLLAVLDSLSKKWRGFDYIHSLFHKKEMLPLNIIIKKKNPEESLFSSVFKFEKISKNFFAGAEAPKWVKYIEVAFGDFGLEQMEKHYKENNVAYTKEKFGSFLFPRYKLVGDGGFPDKVMDILGLVKINKLYTNNEIEDIKTQVKNPNKFCTASTKKYLPSFNNSDYKELIYNSHAYSLLDYDSEKKEFILGNPHWSGLDYKISEKVFQQAFAYAATGELPEHDIWANPHDKEAEFHANAEDSEKVWTFY